METQYKLAARSAQLLAKDAPQDEATRVMASMATAKSQLSKASITLIRSITSSLKLWVIWIYIAVCVSAEWPKLFVCRWENGVRPLWGNAMFFCHCWRRWKNTSQLFTKPWSGPVASLLLPEIQKHKSRASKNKSGRLEMDWPSLNGYKANECKLCPPLKPYKLWVRKLN